MLLLICLLLLNGLLNQCIVGVMSFSSIYRCYNHRIKLRHVLKIHPRPRDMEDFSTDASPGMESGSNGVVLMLHGYAQNSQIFHHKTRSLTRKFTKHGYKCHFLNAPHLLPTASHLNSEGKKVDLETNDRDNARTWWYLSSSIADNSDNTSKEQRKEVILYNGLDETLKIVAETIDSIPIGTFVTLLGFSQGAALGHILAMQNASKIAPFDRIGAMILCGGFASRHQCEPLTNNPSDLIGSELGCHTKEQLSMPSLHVIGESDISVKPEFSLNLMSKFKDPQVLYHPKGHIVPQQAENCKIMVDFLESHAKKAKQESDEDKHAHTMAAVNTTNSKL